jgi:hypothetical protein
MRDIFAARAFQAFHRPDIGYETVPRARVQTAHHGDSLDAALHARMKGHEAIS